VAVTLRVNNSEVKPGGARRIALAFYELRLLDLDVAGEQFDQRALFLEQPSLFEDPMRSVRALHKAGLGPHSPILDVGAGMGLVEHASGAVHGGARRRRRPAPLRRSGGRAIQGRTAPPHVAPLLGAGPV
jgi:hypothetical protein